MATLRGQVYYYAISDGGILMLAHPPPAHPLKETLILLRKPTIGYLFFVPAGKKSSPLFLMPDENIPIK